MKIKNLSISNVLLFSLVSFLFITTSSNGMYEGFWEEYAKEKAEEAAQQQAEQQQRTRESTAPDNEDNPSSTIQRGNLSGGGLGERPLDEIAEIADRLEQYENALSLDSRFPITPEERELFIAYVVEEIDARKAQKAVPDTYSSVKLDMRAHRLVVKESFEAAVIQEQIARLEAEAAEAKYHSTPIYESENRSKLYKASEKAMIRLSRASSLLRLEKMHLDFLDALIKKTLSAEEQHTAYKRFKTALADACKKRVEADTEEERSVGCSTGIKKYFAERDAKLKNEASQAEQDVWKLLNTIVKPITPEERTRFVDQIAERIASYKVAPQILEPSLERTYLVGINQKPAAPVASQRTASGTLAPGAKSEHLGQEPVKTFFSNDNDKSVFSEITQESQFEREKKITLSRLEERLNATRNQLATHQAKQSELEKELPKQLLQQAQQQKQDNLNLQQQVDNFKARYPISSRVPGTDENYQLQALRARRDSAQSATSQTVIAVRSALDSAKNSIDTLSSTIRSLEKEHATVLAELEDYKSDVFKQEVDKAAAIARAEALEWQQAREKLQHSVFNTTSLEGNHSQPLTSPEKQPRASEGATSGEESNNSTLEKEALLAASFNNTTMTEVKRLQEEIDKVHKVVGKARQLIKETKRYRESSELIEAYNRYFDLAEKRSRLKQSLAILIGHTPETLFRRPENVAELLSQYKSANQEESHIKSSDLNRNILLSYLRNFYRTHGVYDMKQHAQHPTKPEQEQSLIEDFQQGYQRVVKKCLEAELAFLAPEEQETVFQQIKDCTWQRMPTFSISQKEDVMNRVRLEARSCGYYTTSSSSSNWQKSEAQRRQARSRQFWNQQFWENNRQQQVRQWNAQQSSMAWSASNNGGYYQPNYRLW